MTCFVTKAMPISYIDTKCYESSVLRNFICCLLHHSLLYLNGFTNCEFSLSVQLLNITTYALGYQNCNFRIIAQLLTAKYIQAMRLVYSYR